jgi:hypothetical protein
MIEIFSIAGTNVSKIRGGTVLFDCSELPELPPLSALRQEHGNHELLVRHYSRMPAGRNLIYQSVGRIVDEKIRFAAFVSEHGQYRSPAIATAVGQELCDRGCRIYLTHVNVNVPSEELVPIRRTWGEYES